MRRPALFLIIHLLLLTPSLLMASSHEKLFAAVSEASNQTQPGLQNYIVTIETSRIKEMMQQLTTRKPEDVAEPPAPIMKKFWQRDGKGLIYPEQVGQAPYVEQMAKQISGNLAIELNKMLLPDDMQTKRTALLKSAEVKVSEVALANTKIKHIEIAFSQPTNLNQAFYVRGMRLPQKKITELSFDIDAEKNTIGEFTVTTADGLNLTVEVRYLAVKGGHIPERYQVTSPDGMIDDSFNVTFIEVDGFTLPATMVRKIRRPNLKEDLEIFFKNYQINKPISDELKARLASQ